MTLKLERVAVVGTSGAGKTWFARELSRRSGLPHIELDALHWGPGWTVRADFAHAAREAAEQACWIIDGNYSAVRDPIWRRATAIVWLNYSFSRVFSRALLRTGKRIVRGERLWAGNRESLFRALFDLEGIPWWIVRTYRRRRREYPALLARPEYASAQLIELEHPTAAEQLLGTITA